MSIGSLLMVCAIYCEDSARWTCIPRGSVRNTGLSDGTQRAWFELEVDRGLAMDSGCPGQEHDVVGELMSQV